MDKNKALHDLNSNVSIVFKILEQLNSGLMSIDQLKEFAPDIRDRKVVIEELLQGLKDE